MPKMHVAILSTDYPPLIGGIATYSYQLAKHLAAKHHVHVFAPSMPGARSFDDAQSFQTVRVIDVPPLRELVFLYRLLRLQANESISVVINPVWFPCALLSYLLSKMTKLRYVVLVHGSEMLDDTRTMKRRIKRVFRRYKMKAFAGASMILANSRFTKDTLTAMGCTTEIAVLHAGVDLDQFRPGPRKEALLDRLKIPRTSRILLTVGRLDLHKGHHSVLEALPQVLKDLPQVVYLIVGDGPERARLERAVDHAGLRRAVRFAGQVSMEDLADYYRLCDVFVMPSRDIEGRLDLVEGFGIAFLEAGACAKPVVGGHAGGVADAVLHDETGLLVDPYRPEEIAEAVIRLCKDGQYANGLGLKGLKRCHDFYNWPAVCDRLEKMMILLNRASEPPCHPRQAFRHRP